jgi:hypothetical protein
VVETGASGRERRELALDLNLIDKIGWGNGSSGRHTPTRSAHAASFFFDSAMKMMIFQLLLVTCVEKV